MKLIELQYGGSRLSAIRFKASKSNHSKLKAHIAANAQFYIDVDERSPNSFIPIIQSLQSAQYHCFIFRQLITATDEKSKLAAMDLVFVSAVVAFPSNTELHARKGMHRIKDTDDMPGVFRAIERFDERIEEIEKAVDIQQAMEFLFAGDGELLTTRKGLDLFQNWMAELFKKPIDRYWLVSNLLFDQLLYTDLSIKIDRLLKSRNLSTAFLYLHRSLAGEPNNVGVLKQLAKIYIDKGRKDLNLQLCRRIQYLSPNSEQAKLRLARANLIYGRPKESFNLIKQVLDTNPKLYGALEEAAATLWVLGKVKQAHKILDQLQQQVVKTSMTRSSLNLLLGNYRAGFEEYQQRPSQYAVSEHIARWNGEALTNKHLVLLGEQGLGDTIFTARYFSQLTDLVGILTVVLPNRQHWVVSQIAPNARCVEEVPADADYFLPVMDLISFCQQPINGVAPFNLGDNRFIQKVAHPYFNMLPPVAIQESTSFRVGIAWQGNKRHDLDVYRSFPLRLLEKLAATPNVTLVSLQAGNGCEQVADVDFSIETPDLNDGMQSFSHTSQLVASLDLVITCDSAMVHLAGAMGVPTWLALSCSSDWRWGIGADGSHWYPSVRLFRQATYDGWSKVFDAMAAALTPLVLQKTID